jgi:hypothetical protein
MTVIFNLWANSKKRRIFQRFCRSKAGYPTDKPEKIKKHASERDDISCLKLHHASILLKEHAETLKDRTKCGLKIIPMKKDGSQSSCCQILHTF